MCSAVDISKVSVPMPLWRFTFMQISTLRKDENRCDEHNVERGGARDRRYGNWSCEAFYPCGCACPQNRGYFVREGR